MEALRLILEPQNHQLVIDIPPGFDQRPLEVIVIPVTENTLETTPTNRRRWPSPILAGTVTLIDELIVPAVPESDWDALN